jgi:hypothetical protein
VHHRQMRLGRRPPHVAKPEQARHGPSPAVWQGETSRRPYVNWVQTLAGWRFHGARSARAAPFFLFGWWAMRGQRAALRTRRRARSVRPPSGGPDHRGRNRAAACFGHWRLGHPVGVLPAQARPRLPSTIKAGGPLVCHHRPA